MCVCVCVCVWDGRGEARYVILIRISFNVSLHKGKAPFVPFPLIPGLHIYFCQLCLDNILHINVLYINDILLWKYKTITHTSHDDRMCCYWLLHLSVVESFWIIDSLIDDIWEYLSTPIVCVSVCVSGISQVNQQPT